MQLGLRDIMYKLPQFLPDPFTRTLVEWKATANATNIGIPSNENIATLRLVNKEMLNGGKLYSLLHAQAQALWRVHTNFPRPNPQERAGLAKTTCSYVRLSIIQIAECDKVNKCRDTFRAKHCMHEYI